MSLKYMMTYSYLTAEFLHVVSANLTGVLNQKKTQYNSTSEKLGKLFHLLKFCVSTAEVHMSQNPICMYKNNHKMEGYGSHCYEDLEE